MNSQTETDTSEALSSLQAVFAQKAIISTAIGILMERYTTDYGEAAALLDRTAQSTGSEVFDLAEQLVRTGWADTL